MAKLGGRASSSAMSSKAVGRDTAIVTIVKIAVLLAIGFIFFGASQRPHVDIGAHLLAGAQSLQSTR